MNLAQQLPQHEHVLALAERVRKKYSSVVGQCEPMTNDLVKELSEAGFRVEHALVNFYLDEPVAYKYAKVDKREIDDEYAVNHDWVTIEGMILDISASQFRKDVHEPIPDIVFVGPADRFSNRYEELGYGE